MTTNLIDTNILVYANNEDSKFHAVCKSLVEKAINGKIKAVVAVQNLIELYAVITDKRRVEHPLTPTKAKELIEFYSGFCGHSPSYGASHWLVLPVLSNVKG